MAVIEYAFLVKYIIPFLRTDVGIQRTILSKIYGHAVGNE